MSAVIWLTLKKPTITRSFRSFLQAYTPEVGIIITKSLLATEKFEETEVHFIPLELIDRMFPIVLEVLGL